MNNIKKLYNPSILLFVNEKNGAVAVELGIVLALILMPLVLGSSLMFFVMTSRVEVSSSLEQIEEYVVQNPNYSTNQTIVQQYIGLRNQGFLGKVVVAQPFLSFTCLDTTTGQVSAANISYQPGYGPSSLGTSAASNDITGNSVPSSTANIDNGTIGVASCATGDVQTNISLSLTIQTSLPVSAFGQSGLFNTGDQATIWIH